MVPGLGGGPCSYLDQCVFALQGGDDVFEWLKLDFKRHYDVRIGPEGPIWGKIGLHLLNVNSGWADIGSTNFKWGYPILV